MHIFSLINKALAGFRGEWMIVSSELVHGLTKTQDPREGYMCMC